MSSVDKLAKELKSLINESNDRKPKAYDTDAQVVRIEDDILWVHIPGGVEETPVKKTINALPGDTVKVHIENGGAWVSGNSSAPPTDDRQANIATNIATTADAKAGEAINNAERAKLAADSAEESAATAKELAEEVRDTAEEVKIIADNAQASADTANDAAMDALRNLSDIEKVVDTVSWIAEHGSYLITEDLSVNANHIYYSLNPLEYTYTLTEDTTLNKHKQYYKLEDDSYIPIKKSEEDETLINTYYEINNGSWGVVTEPKDEEISGYYQLDISEGVSNYVASHLSLTNDGLIVTSDSSKYKLLLANDGMRVLDPEGNIVGLHGETIRLGSENELHFEARSDILKFCTPNEDICWFGKNAQGIWEMHIDTAYVEDMMRYGNYAFIKRNNGNMSLKWLGD